MGSNGHNQIRVLSQSSKSSYNTFTCFYSEGDNKEVPAYRNYSMEPSMEHVKRVLARWQVFC